MTKDDKVISGIINSFKNHGIRDIKHNRNHPIAAFILSICFIDQLASFRYPLSATDLNNRVEAFISQYLPSFKGLNVYSIKNIAKDEELTLDYSTFLDENMEAFKCICGSENCKGIIKGSK